MSATTGASERWRSLVLLLTMGATVTASIIVGLQADAGIRSEIANRQSQVFALLASGEMFRQGIRTDYDIATLASVTKEMQDGLSLEITALEQEAEGEAESAALARQRAAVLQGRVERGRALSVFYSDPSYMADSPDALPDPQAYIANTFAEANRLVVLQNEQADAYQRWSRRGDGYVAVLALLSVSLFMFGLAQAASVRTRRTFTIFGAIVLGTGLAWAISILAS
ncbi:MAG: hypothetical protein MUO23_05495 [Anaerolineales bacterium]|nr:hypothetical protein [Anaerolineales bacterium]